jgi:uncharacterized protein (TIGR02284 family)
MLLRDDKQAAMNDLLVALEDAADRYHDAAQIAHEPALASLFQRLSRRRREMAREAERHLRKLGDLPRTPDSDLEALESLLTHVKAALSPDERRTLLQERERTEARIEDLIKTALATSLAPEMEASLQRMHEEVAATRQELSASAVSPS